MLFSRAPAEGSSDPSGGEACSALLCPALSRHVTSCLTGLFPQAGYSKINFLASEKLFMSLEVPSGGI